VSFIDIMERLFQYLHSYYPLSWELKYRLTQILKFKKFRKRAFILEEGQICEKIYFIERGLLRCFHLKAGNQVSNWFMKEGDVAIAVESFFGRVPSYQFIQALEETDVYYITYSELQAICREFNEFYIHRCLIVEKYYMLSEQRHFAIQCQSATEKYKYLVDHSPDLLRRVASKYIASFVGLSEVHFSAIKSQI
jgi:CRP-like cAMP-binding protein